MKCFILLSVFSALCCAAWATTPTRFVDYDTCTWKKGSATNKISCDTGYVATGACGNKGQNRCDNAAFGLECCKMKNGTITGNCEEHSGNKGASISCGSNTQVFGTCGSLDMSRCSHNGNLKCITINCCPSSLNVDYDDTKCKWSYAANQGENLYCDRHAGGEMVLVGRCGSETMAQCGGGNVHGIKCCPLI